jgi:hypothetical protein
VAEGFLAVIFYHYDHLQESFFDSSFDVPGKVIRNKTGSFENGGSLFSEN